MIKYLWRMWRHPSGLFVRNVGINFDLQPMPGRNPEWICGFEIISICPWNRVINVQLEIREPPEIMGTEGKLTNLIIRAMSVNMVNPSRFPLSNQAYNYLRSRNKQSPDFLPIRIMISGRDVKHQGYFSESINYVLQG